MAISFYTIEASTRTYKNNKKPSPKSVFKDFSFPFSTPQEFKEIDEIFKNDINSEVNTVKNDLELLQNDLELKSALIDDLQSTPQNVVSSAKIQINKEIPTGKINGENRIFSLTHTPTPGSDHLYLNGLLIEESSSADYSISGSNIVFLEPIPSSSKLHCTYYYNDSTPIKIFSDKEIPTGNIDGVNNSFTLSYIPIEGSEHIYLNGLLQESGIGNDYIIYDSNITFFTPPEKDFKLRCTYYYNL